MTGPAGAPAGGPVTIPFLEYRALVADAAAWQALIASPHVADLLAEWIEWRRRRTARETSHAICAAADWKAIAGAPTYAELAARRAVATTEPLSPAQIRERAAASWAEEERLTAARRRAA